MVATAKNQDNKSISAIALLSIENINNNIIHEVIESLIKETNAAPFEMTFYIGACASKTNLLVNEEDLTSSIFTKDTLIKKNKKTYLDIRYAIFNELVKEIADPNYIYFDQTDTVIDEKSFSKLANKLGKNLTCVVYQDEEI